MSVGGFDIELNGVKYNIAEDAQGTGYLLVGEALRPPNAQVVQGASGNQTFQIKPDTLLWSLSDWSGGEAQQIWSLQAANTWRTLDAVDPFTRPGTVTPGPFLVKTDDTGGTFDKVVHLVSITDTLYGFDVLDNEYYTWNPGTEVWDGPQVISGPANSKGAFALCHDGDEIFWITNESGGQELWRIDPGASIATSVASTVLGMGYSIAAQGNNIYVSPEVDPFVAPGSRSIHEVAKSGSTPVELDSVTISNVRTLLVPMEGKIYAITSDSHRTEIRIITPTSAAGTGFGTQFALIEGFGAHSAWQHSGILYMAGQYGVTDKGQIMYIQPNGTYGALSTIRRTEVDDQDFLGIGRATTGNSRLIEHYFVTGKRSDTDDDPSIWVIDAVSGGYANFSYPESNENTFNTVHSLAVFRDEVFFCGANSGITAGRVYRAKAGTFMKASSVVSPWHDFGLAEEKILAALVLSVESLPADWTVKVDYAIDGATSFTTHITYTTTSGKGERSAVSTDSATVKFRTLSIRVSMTYTGSGVPTSAPVIRGIDVYAQVARLQKVYSLLLDLSNDKSGPNSGERKRTNIVTAAETEKVLDFKDGYKATPGVFATLDVVIDSYQIEMTQPGEGIAAVTLKEV